MLSREIQNLPAQTSRLAADTAVSAGRIGAVTRGLLLCIETHALLRERLVRRRRAVLIAAKTSTRLHGWRLDYTFERFGIAETRLRIDPWRDLRGALEKLMTTHFSAITEPRPRSAALGTRRREEALWLARYPRIHHRSLCGPRPLTPNRCAKVRGSVCPWHNLAPG